jgi:hypothetical protein
MLVSLNSRFNLDPPFPPLPLIHPPLQASAASSSFLLLLLVFVVASAEDTGPSLSSLRGMIARSSYLITSPEKCQHKGSIPLLGEARKLREKGNPCSPLLSIYYFFFGREGI